MTRGNPTTVINVNGGGWSLSFDTLTRNLYSGPDLSGFMFNTGIQPSAPSTSVSSTPPSTSLSGLNFWSDVPRFTLSFSSTAMTYLNSLVSSPIPYILAYSQTPNIINIFGNLPTSSGSINQIFSYNTSTNIFTYGIDGIGSTLNSGSPPTSSTSSTTSLIIGQNYTHSTSDTITFNVDGTCTIHILADTTVPGGTFQYFTPSYTDNHNGTYSLTIGTSMHNYVQSMGITIPNPGQRLTLNYNSSGVFWPDNTSSNFFSAPI
jgi:hypothetical protein